MQSRLGKQEETKYEYAADSFLVLGPFSRRFSHLSASCYNISFIKFKVTLEMLTPKVKKKKKTEREREMRGTLLKCLVVLALEH